MEYFPPEINYRILSQYHPFHNYKLCREVPEPCNEIGYDILQTWIWPLLSVREIEEMLPNITYEDVVALALIYNPIPESVRYYDSLHLLYYACLKNNDDISEFVSLIPSKYMLTVANIALKFGRNEIIHLLSNKQGIDARDIIKLEFIDSMIRVKNGEKLISAKPFSFQDIVLPIGIWTWTELAEIIVILSVLYPTFQPSLSSLFGLNRINSTAIVDSVYYRQGYEIANHVSNVADIMKKYGRTLPPTLSKVENLKVTDTRFLTSYKAALKEPVTSEGHRMGAVASEAPSDSGKFYIESAMYVEYINWRNAGNELTRDDDTHGVSILGVPSRNLEYVAVYGGDLNE